MGDVIIPEILRLEDIAKSEADSVDSAIVSFVRECVGLRYNVIFGSASYWYHNASPSDTTVAITNENDACRLVAIIRGFDDAEEVAATLSDLLVAFKEKESSGGSNGVSTH